MSLTIDNRTAGFKLAVGSEVWLESSDTAMTSDYATKSSKDGSLGLDSGFPATGMGSDSLGEFTSTAFSWEGGAFVTTFRDYGHAVVFEQAFPKGAQGMTLNKTDPMNARDHVSSRFPSIAAGGGGGGGNDLGFLAFSGDMTGSGYKYGTLRSETGSVRLPTGVAGFGPAAIFNRDASSSVVLSSYSQFMAASNGPAPDGGVAYGLQGSITEVPAGYTLSFVVALSPAGGVNAAFEHWGDLMLTRYGKSRDVTYRDYSLRYLGYSTDNGAYYYYQTEDRPPKRGPPYDGGKTYQQTLIDVKDYADAHAIPYKYILLDSWWYYQGVGSGVTEWISRPDVFPDGNAFLRNATGWPIMGHNRFWAIDNKYARQNGGGYDFVVEKKGEAQPGGSAGRNYAWPEEQRFWDDLLYNSTQWGLFMYEQDWLDTEYDNVVHLNVNATAARTWLLQMGTAAARNDLTIQYCMSHCRHIMQSLEIPAVTNARASGDYHAGGDQWQQLGTTGIFAWAVAIAPTKDNFWSTDVQTGSAYGDHDTIKEPFNRLQSAVSTLSKGPVAPSDKIGRSDAALILKSCTADGSLLQGDKPAMVIDAVHKAKAFGSGGGGGSGDQVWATHTELSGQTFGVVMGATLESDRAFSMRDVGLDPSTSYMGYESNSTATMVPFYSSLQGGTQLRLHKCGKWDFQVWALAPVLPNGWTFVGEQEKWVPVSATRFSKLEYWKSGPASSGVSVVAAGHKGETIHVTFAAPAAIAAAAAAPTTTTVSCTIPEGSTVAIKISTESPAGSCVVV